jgi:hypothetical protein
LIGVLIGGDPVENGGLVGPSAMALGHAGELLVASQLTGQVLRYDANSGEYLGEFGSQINGPSGLLYDEARDRLYVSTLGNFDSELVLHYRASDGELIGSFGEGTGPSGRTSITFGPDQQLYVSSFANDEFFSGSVLKFDGETLDPLGTFAATQGLAGANGLVFRPAASPDNYTLDVVGLFSATVARFDVSKDANGDLINNGGTIFIGTELDFPSSILDLQDGTLLISNLGNDNPATGELRPGSVGRFDAVSGQFLGAFLTPGGAGNLSQPTDMLLLSPLNLDCNGDGTTDQADVDCACAAGGVLDELLAAIGSLKGDADFDGKVQFSDYVILAENFGGEGSYGQGDFDCDGLVQFSDFVILANNFGQTAGGVAAVPEPAAGLLLLLGSALLGLAARRDLMATGARPNFE